MGTALLLVATSAVLMAAWLIAWRALGDRAGAALRGVGAGVIAHVLIVLPTWVLGALGELTRLRVVVVVLSVAAVGAAVAATGRGAAAMAQLRADALAVRASLRRARSMWLSTLKSEASTKS